MTEFMYASVVDKEAEMDELNIPVLLGTIVARKSAFVRSGGWRNEEAAGNSHAPLRLSEFDLPHDDYGQKSRNAFPTWRDAIVNADGLVIVTP